MAKTKKADTIALNKGDQKKVARKTKALKKKITTGIISIHETKKKLKETAEQQRGLIYISHLPHGFYEDQLKDYFKQFGVVTNVKLCRSSKTGNSKGFGYVEFAHPEVAQIAAESMDNYLMFKKRIVVSYIPYEKRPKCLFYGKSSTKENFSTQTRRDKQAAHKNRQLSPEELSGQKKNFVKKLSAKLQKLKKHGIDTDLELTGPLLENTQDQGTQPTHTYEPDEYDSEVEYKVPIKQAKNTPKRSSLKVKDLPSVLEIKQKIDTWSVSSSSGGKPKTSKDKRKTRAKSDGQILQKPKKKILTVRSEKAKKIKAQFFKIDNPLINAVKYSKKISKKN